MPSSTPSPRRTLSKLRRNRSPNNTSSSSLANSTADDSSEAGGLRASLDAAVGKVKERTRKSSISDRRGSGESTGRRLTTLLSRRQKSPKPDSLTLERNLSVQSSYSDNGSVLSIPGNKSDSSLPDDSGRSSLLTDDGSDVDRYVCNSFRTYGSHVTRNDERCTFGHSYDRQTCSRNAEPELLLAAWNSKPNHEGRVQQLAFQRHVQCCRAL